MRWRQRTLFSGRSDTDAAPVNAQTAPRSGALQSSSSTVTSLSIMGDSASGKVMVKSESRDDNGYVEISVNWNE
ncbi:hypothetical protein [Paenibacillus dendritiformis]|uniref:hypothetical protein n=1 Tax=Paenibacillus dendritiformis TaxID=130049 RepID=UPI00387E0BF9